MSLDVKELIEVIKSAESTPKYPCEITTVYCETCNENHDFDDAYKDGFENFRDRMLVYLQQEWLKELDEKHKSNVHI